MIRRIVAVVVALAAGACSSQAASPPAPTRPALLALVLAADDARTAALAGGPAQLEHFFAGDALRLQRQRADRTTRLDQRWERRLLRRELVHWAGRPGAGDAVLSISALSRLVSPGSASAWARTLEQWSVAVGWSGGWRITSARDLPPSEWWPT